MLTLSSFPSCSSSAPRRRTMSFNASSSCLPPKASRSASTLRRTGSYLSLSELSAGDSRPTTDSCVSVRRFIETQEKRFKQSHELTITSRKPSSMLSASNASSRHTHQQRKSSPLSPVPHLLPPRPSFPRSKPEPDLYKVAIITRMRTSHGGQKTIVSVLSAMRDLELLVAGQRKDGDGDVIMGDVDESSNNPWFIISSDDRELTC